MSYLTDLTLQLTLGAQSLDAETRRRHAGYLLAAQRADGGFAGREGGSDPYYTGFALRSLMILDQLTPSVAERAAGFLSQRLVGHEGVVDLISLVFAAAILEIGAGVEVLAEAPEDWPLRLSQLLETYRRDDGGYAKSPEGRVSSTYQTFLTTICYELIEVAQPDPHKAVEFLLAREHPEGGFLEIRVAKRAGVNPTAAAIGALKTLRALTPEISERTCDFLLDQQSDEGGFTANTRIPLADLLSTCTATITLNDLSALEHLDRAAAIDFVRTMERPQGGFGGFAYDTADDVEYTFYGLAALALLNQPHSQA